MRSACRGGDRRTGRTGRMRAEDGPGHRHGRRAPVATGRPASPDRPRRTSRKLPRHRDRRSAIGVQAPFRDHRSVPPGAMPTDPSTRTRTAHQATGAHRGRLPSRRPTSITAAGPTWSSSAAATRASTASSSPTGGHRPAAAWESATPSPSPSSATRSCAATSSARPPSTSGLRSQRAEHVSGRVATSGSATTRSVRSR